MRKTVQDIQYGEKHWKTGKKRNTHCRTCIMARKLKNVDKETQTLLDLEYVKITENGGKSKMHTLGPGVRQGN